MIKGKVKATKVAFQGERGAYGEMAAIQYFPKAELVPLKAFQDVFDSVQERKVDFAVVPVENSIEGSINEVYDLLLQTDGTVVSGEVYQRIRHCLISNKSTKKIKSVYSHPQALAQCRNYLAAKKLESVPAYDTAGSVKLIKEKRLMDSAAIASKRAAELYSMKIIEEGIEDRKNNFTRFLVISLSRPADIRTEQTGHDKTSIIISVKHVPGALFAILGEFAERKINLTKIESRPTKETPWEYNFYVDLDGHIKDKVVNDALEAIKDKTSFIKILGSYRKAEFS